MASAASPYDVRVTPDDVYATAKRVMGAADAMYDAQGSLAAALSAHGGMAGNDPHGRAFGSHYDTAAAHVPGALTVAIALVAGMAQGLMQIANNLLAADHKSATGKSGGTPDQYPMLQSPQQVDSAAASEGFMKAVTPDPPPPSSQGSDSIPDWLSKYWPNGHQDQLRDAGRAYGACSQALGDADQQVRAAMNQLLGSNKAESLDAARAYYSFISDDAAPESAPLSAARQACGQLASVCDQYANQIDQAHSATISQLESGAGIAVGTLTVLMILTTPETGGLPDLIGGAIDESAIESLLASVGEALDGFLADVASSLARIPSILTDVISRVPIISRIVSEGEDVDEAVVEEETGEPETGGDSPGSDGPEPGASGPKPDNGGLGPLESANAPDPAAPRLAQRIGGQPSVKFANGPDSEFDAVSDQYVAQSKPANFKLGSDFRDQAKVTFEVAIQSGRIPYFQFDGPPGPGVLSALQRYAARYGIEPVIDLTPLGGN
ncbi:MAG: hypothetical protein J2P25_21280 [Nocardiopsaceae bacterium]|nr:hypothetical protein [Nocardiopsaceae bacterium]